MPPRRRRYVRRTSGPPRRPGYGRGPGRPPAYGRPTSGAYRRRRYRRRTGGLATLALSLLPGAVSAVGKSINGIKDIWKKK